MELRIRTNASFPSSRNCADVWVCRACRRQPAGSRRPGRPRPGRWVPGPQSPPHIWRWELHV